MGLSCVKLPNSTVSGNKLRPSFPRSVPSQQFAPGRKKLGLASYAPICTIKSTRSEPLSLVICLNATNFVLLNASRDNLLKNFL